MRPAAFRYPDSPELRAMLPDRRDMANAMLDLLELRRHRPT